LQRGRFFFSGGVEVSGRRDRRRWLRRWPKRSMTEMGRGADRRDKKREKKERRWKREKYALFSYLLQTAEDRPHVEMVIP
jgi:hypothetical protein